MADTMVVNLAHTVARAEEEEYSGLVGELQAQVLGPDGGRHKLYSVDAGDGPEDMPAGRLLANLVLLYPYRAAGVEPGPGRAIRSQLDADSAQAHMDRTIAELYSRIEPDALSRAAAAAYNFAADLASSVAGRVGTSVSIIGLFEAAEADPRIGELLFWETPAGELEAIEAAADAAGAELNSRLMALPGEYGRLLRCGAAVNRDQLRQAIVSVGVKPGLQDGELIPEPIDTSFLRGMRGPQDMYICAGGARKALVTNYRQVKDSGYLARKLVLLVSGHSIDPDLFDCGTRHGIRTSVLSADHAHRLAGRFVCGPAEDPSVHAQEMSEEELLGNIGEEIILRSPVTCAGPSGCCHVCYGSLARTNAGIHAGVYGTLVISEQITQRLLSSKHLLKARPTPIEWPPEFTAAFTVERATIVAESIVDKVYVEVSDLEEAEAEGDGDEGGRTTTVFYFRVAGRQARTKITVPVPIFLDEDAWEGREDDEGLLAITPVPEVPIFQVLVTNTDLSEALRDIFRLIEREELSDHHEAYNRLAALLEKSAIHTPSVHAEMILRALARDPADNMARPDFSGGEEPPVAMLKLMAAILTSPSVTNSLAFERVKAQLVGFEILQKQGEGVLDALFGG
jgi:hypothetical protein